MLILIIQIIRIILLLAFLAILGYITYIMISFKNIVPFVPTPRKVVRFMVDLAEVKKGERIIDLGSGTGTILIGVAKKGKNNLIIGIEKYLLLRIITKIRLLFHPVIKKRIQVLNKDFLNLDLYAFDVIFCFLTPEALRLLEPRFQFLKKGSRVVVYMFHLEEFENFEETIEHVSAKDTIYVYKKIK